MKTFALPFLFLILVPSIKAQDTPGTAFEAYHSWSQAEYEYSTFVGMSDSPEHPATGPDVWVSFTANSSELVVYIESTMAIWYENFDVQIFDDAFINVTGDLSSGEMEYSGLIEGATYTLGIAYVGDDPVEGQMVVGLTDDYYRCLGDFEGDGFRNMNDLLLFLVDYGQSGKLDQDVNHDQEVNTVDLLQFISWVGHLCPSLLD